MCLSTSSRLVSKLLNKGNKLGELKQYWKLRSWHKTSLFDVEEVRVIQKYLKEKDNEIYCSINFSRIEFIIFNFFAARFIVVLEEIHLLNFQAVTQCC